MGQYYKIVNLDRQEYLNPWEFGDGQKLMEFGCSGGGAMAGLAILLANSNGRGGGDLRSDNPIIGSWAGDRIVIAGDYAEIGDACEAYVKKNIYDLCSDNAGDDHPKMKNISADVINALMDDPYLAADLNANPIVSARIA
jgi:hypothetical protein